jgi:S-adenosylmethionine decarboxylase
MITPVNQASTEGISDQMSLEGGDIAHFGSHLTIDGYGGSALCLNDRALIANLLESLPERLGMYPLHEPFVLTVPPLSAKDSGGYSGFVIVAESHISLHTFPERGFVSADVYTCKSTMDTVAVIEHFKQTFKLREVETNFIVRGKRFHEQAELAAALD